jgi:hypothetical protein
MIQQDFYTGEPVQSGSPITSTGLSTDVEAANMASFGKYDYDSGMRNNNMIDYNNQYNMGYPNNMQYNNPYGYNNQYNNGYNMGYPNNMQYNNPYGYNNMNYNPYNYNSYTSMNSGIGAPPIQYNNNQYNYQYGANPQPSYNQYSQQPASYHIPGFAPMGEYILPSDFDDRLFNLELEYIDRMEEIDAEQYLKRQESPYGNNGYNNYYGLPYYNPYQYTALNNEFKSRLDAIREEARQNAINLNIKLLTMAYTYNGYNVSDEKIREICEGKTVDIPQQYNNTNNIHTANNEYNIPSCPSYDRRYVIPVDNSYVYRQRMSDLIKQHREFIPEDADMNTAFNNLGLIYSEWEMEEERHRQRDMTNIYNSNDNAYKKFVRRKAFERHLREKGITNQEVIDAKLQNFDARSLKERFIASSPILSQSAHLADDGTLNVSINLPCNIGSHKGENYTANGTVTDSLEKAYEEKKERFAKFLDSIPSNIYLDQLKQLKLENYDG